MTISEMTDNEFLTALMGDDSHVPFAPEPTTAKPANWQFLPSSWHTIEPGVQQRWGKGGMRYRVRFKRRTYLTVSLEESRDLISLLRKHRGNTSGYSSPRKTIELI